MTKAKNEIKHVVTMDDATWRIEEGNGSARVYCYVLAGTSSSLVIDTGLGILDIRGIAQRLTSLPLIVVNTHGHLDHVSRNYQFDRVYLSPADEEVFRAQTSYDVRYGFVKGLLAEKHLPGWLVRLPVIRGHIRRLCSVPARENRLAIADGDTIDLGGRTIRAIATPGHTMGSICLLDTERRWLYTGDTVCAGGVLLHFDHSAGVATYLESIRRLMQMSESFDLMWPAHHILPLKTEKLEEYVACAETILAGTANTFVHHSAAGTGIVARCGGVALSYRAEKSE